MRNHNETVLAFPCVAVPCLLTSAQNLSAQDLVITNARIITGTGAVIDRGSVVVRDGRIVSVAAGSASVPGATTIDARGMTAMPGFIDAHRHIMSGNDDRWFKEESVERMREFLEAGYTTLMSGGGPFPGILELKRRVESGALKGPRIITSGRVDPDNFKTEDAGAGAGARSTHRQASRSSRRASTPNRPLSRRRSSPSSWTRRGRTSSM